MEPAKERERKLRKPRASNGSYVMGFVIITFIITLIGGTIFRSMRPKRSCHYDGAYRRLVCKFKDRTELPDDLTENALFLQIGEPNDKLENEFSVLSRSNFSRFKHLQGLTLIKCGIEQVEIESFIDVPKVKRLDLRYNRIRSLPEKTFYGLLELEVLLLGNNPLLDLAAGVFIETSIDFLSLGNNPTLSHISENAFENSTIHQLELLKCSITTLEKETFKPITESLRVLTINNNLQPLDIQERLFENLTLSLIDLSNNGLRDVSFIAHLEADAIILAHNPLQLESDISSTASNISFAQTQLQSISHVNFSLFTNLRYLDLSGNKLTRFNISEFERMQLLETIDASNNDIYAIEGDLSNPALLPNMEVLYIHENYVQLIPSEIQPVFDHLQNVSLHGNPLHCNCEVSIILFLLEFYIASRKNYNYFDIDFVNGVQP